MRKYATAYQAAKAYAKENNEKDEFEKSYNDYTDTLYTEGLIKEIQSDTWGSPRWIVHDGTGWYVFDQNGKTIHGPYEKKKIAMSAINEDTSSHITAGVYKAENSGFYVARKNAFEEWFAA